MGSRQREFLDTFKTKFAACFTAELVWAGGQLTANTARLDPDTAIRRNGLLRAGEAFEIGDLRCDLTSRTVIIEYESSAIAVHNLLKYWPYLRGELSQKPTRPIVMCHFSDWVSYGSHRDLWQWTLRRIQEDHSLLVSFDARQFDHWGADPEKAHASIQDAIAWIESESR